LKEKITKKLKLIKGCKKYKNGAMLSVIHGCCYCAYHESPLQAEHVYLTCQAWREAHGRLKELMLL